MLCAPFISMLSATKKRTAQSSFNHMELYFFNFSYTHVRSSMEQFTRSSGTMRHGTVYPSRTVTFCGLNKPKCVFPSAIPVRRTISIRSSGENKKQECTNLMINDCCCKIIGCDLVPSNFVLGLWLFSTLPAEAAAEAPLNGGPPASSYYVSLGLFLLTLPGEWSGV